MSTKVISSGNLYVCSHCNYSTDKSANLVRHRKTMHETVKESILCCGQSFLSKADYREHNKFAHINGHKCPICERKFSRRALLRRHLSVHTGFKEFKCDLCTYASSHKSNLVRHRKVHRNKSTEMMMMKIEIESNNNNNNNPSQPDSTTSPVLPHHFCESQNSHIIVKPYPMLRSMLAPPSSTITSNSEEICKSKLSHSVDSILGGNNYEAGKIQQQQQFSCQHNNGSFIDEVTSTSTLVNPSMITKYENGLTDVGVDTLQKESRPQGMKDNTCWYPNVYWPTINGSSSSFGCYANTSLHTYNFQSGYDAPYSSFYPQYCYPFTHFFPSNCGSTMNDPGQDSRTSFFKIPTSPYAVNNSTTSCYRTFQPRVLISNATPSTPSDEYQLSPAGLTSSTDSSQYSTL